MPAQNLETLKRRSFVHEVEVKDSFKCQLIEERGTRFIVIVTEIIFDS
jgi:hypothetical protein